MGQTNYYKLYDMEQKTSKKLVDEHHLKLTKEVYRIPIYGEDDLLGEVRFEILEK